MKIKSHKPIIFKDIKYYYSPNGYFSSKNPYKQLHRAILEDHLGVIIPPGYDVHHKDENSMNNDPSNLVMLLKADHMRLHMLKRSYVGNICVGCGKQFQCRSDINKKYCTKSCREKIAWQKNKIKLNCLFCGVEFYRNKYADSACCSISCGKYFKYKGIKNGE